MRNVSNNRFVLTCFCPVVSRAVVDRFACPRSASIPVNKHDAQSNSEIKAKFPDLEFAFARKCFVPRPLKPTFSKVNKAVVFETVLNTRARSANDLYGQNCGYSVYAESSSAGDEKQAFVDRATNIQKIKPPEWSSSISSSNSPESESKNTSKSESSKDQVENQNKFQSIGVYWVLVSLAVTVVWGKINVIILTSILVSFSSLWNASSCGTKGIPKLSNAECQVYKNSHKDCNGRKGSQWALNLLRDILIFVLEGLL
ncbi:hypothetical protein VNO78_13921 [Psophocarpus tetragonolobus]|uniref:Uncharacterized protein n=1 Tax=Psophocarpus tetragonolobus TaxID=3891 RepID=A0AAN9SPV7_PSOTE